MNYAPHRSNKLILLTCCCIFNYQNSIRRKGFKQSVFLLLREDFKALHIFQRLFSFSWVSALRYRTGGQFFLNSVPEQQNPDSQGGQPTLHFFQ